MAQRDQLVSQAIGFLQRGDLARAEPLLKQLLAANPSDAIALQLAGGAAVQRGDLTAGRALLQRAVSINPRHAETRSNLGVALMQSGLDADAERELRAALALKPNLPAASINLVHVLVKLGQLIEAEELARSTVAANPTSADAYQALGSALDARGDFQGAVAAHQRAIALAPQRPDLLAELATTYVSHGRFKEATRELERAIALSPADPRWRQRLAQIGSDENSVAQLRALYASAPEGERKANLAFTLAKALDDIGDYPAAMSAFIEANHMRRRTYQYSASEFASNFERIAEAFSAELLAERKGVGPPDDMPIFVVGMPRSGTTLVEQILASHPQVFGVGEISLLGRLVNEAIPSASAEQKWKALSASPTPTLSRIAIEYVAGLRALASGEPYVVDKSLSNFAYVGLIAMTFPRAKIIHTRRDPLDTCVSIFKSDFGAFHPYARDMVELGEYYTHYAALMQHWHRVLPGRIHDLDYAALVDDQEGETRRLLAHCGLDWSDSCMSFFETERPVRTLSAVQVRQPMNRRGIGIAARYGALLDPLRSALAPLYGVETR